MPDHAPSTQAPADAPPKPLITPAALALPLASGAAYGLAYCYELGYTETFRIPRGVVTISLADFLVAAFGSVTFLIGLWFWIALWVAMGARSSKTWFQASCVSIGIALPALGLVLLIWLAGYHVPALVMLAAVGVGIVAGIVDEAHGSDTEAKEPGPFNRVFGWPLEGARRWFGRYAGHLLGAAVIAGAASFLLGRSHARNPDSFVGVEEIPGYVVLRTYREHVVMGSHVPAAGEVGEFVRVYSWADLAGMTLYRVPRRVPTVVGPVAAPAIPSPPPATNPLLHQGPPPPGP